MPEMDMGPTRMGFLLHDQEKGGVGGAIVAGSDGKPSREGARVFLNGGTDLNTVLHRVETAGGKIVLEKTAISPDHGHYASFLDSEGNQVFIHSMG